MNERETLLKRIQVCDFALNDAALFLDTHPEDQLALEYYQKYKQLREKAIAVYTRAYGPIHQTDHHDAPRWEWGNNPWPWHLAEEEE